KRRTHPRAGGLVPAVPWILPLLSEQKTATPPLPIAFWTGWFTVPIASNSTANRSARSREAGHEQATTGSQAVHRLVRRRMAVRTGTRRVVRCGVQTLRLVVSERGPAHRSTAEHRAGAFFGFEETGALDRIGATRTGRAGRVLVDGGGCVGDS